MVDDVLRAGRRGLQMALQPHNAITHGEGLLRIQRAAGQVHRTGG